MRYLTWRDLSRLLLTAVITSCFSETERLRAAVWTHSLNPESKLGSHLCPRAAGLRYTFILTLLDKSCTIIQFFLLQCDLRWLNAQHVVPWQNTQEKIRHLHQFDGALKEKVHCGWHRWPRMWMFEGTLRSDGHAGPNNTLFSLC